jgi:hypothetical protein
MDAAPAPRDDPYTLPAIGVVAALASATGHEALGHGVACVAVGGRITLLTTTHFQCAGGPPLVDAAGPAMNLVLAALGAIGLGLVRRPALKVFFLALLAFNAFWFAGEALRSSLTHEDDEWALALRLGWPSWWRPACLAFAVAIYAVAVRRLVGPLRACGLGPGEGAAGARSLRLLAGGAVALGIAGACWARDPVGGAFEGVLSIAGASAPLLISARLARQRGPSGEPTALPRSAAWIGLAIAVLVVFCLTQGRGYGQEA